jgi:hypothetical protein
MAFPNRGCNTSGSGYGDAVTRARSCRERARRGLRRHRDHDGLPRGGFARPRQIGGRRAAQGATNLGWVAPTGSPPRGYSAAQPSRDSPSGRPLGASRTPRSHRSASTRPRGATRRRRSGSTSRTTSSTASASPRRSASSIKEGLAKNLLCRRRRADSPRGSSRRPRPYLEPIRSRPASAASERPARPGDERHSANPS